MLAHVIAHTRQFKGRSPSAPVASDAFWCVVVFLAAVSACGGGQSPAPNAGQFAANTSFTAGFGGSREALSPEHSSSTPADHLRQGRALTERRGGETWRRLNDHSSGVWAFDDDFGRFDGALESIVAIAAATNHITTVPTCVTSRGPPAC